MTLNVNTTVFVSQKTPRHLHYTFKCEPDECLFLTFSRAVIPPPDVQGVTMSFLQLLRQDLQGKARHLS